MSDSAEEKAVMGKPEEGLSAEEIAKEFKEHSVAEFFKKNRQMLGLTGKIKTLTTIVHEYLTNSLDACEEAKILPDLEVRISELGPDYYEVYVRDNGPGLTRETVGKALGQLLAGTKFHRMIQSRGHQGIAAAGVTMLSQTTTGKPIQVITGTGKGKPFTLELTIDPKKNEPKASKLEELNKEFKGLAIKAKFKDVKYQRSDQGPLEYLRRSAISNPHAQLTFTEPDGTRTVFKRSNKDIPRKPVPIKPHPRGVSVDELITMAKHTAARKVNSFLKREFERMGDTAIKEITKHVSFDLEKDPRKLAWDEAEEIIKQFKNIQFMNPSTDSLRPIGEHRIKTSMKSIIEPALLEVITRKPSVYQGGFPFQVEVGVAFGGNSGRVTGTDEEGQSMRKAEIMRFANRTPLLFDAGGCALTKAVYSIDWKRYGVRDLDSAPLTIFIHLISVHIPYTGAGKQAVSDEDEIMEELRLALMDVGRKIFKFIGQKRREEEKEKKRRLFYKHASEVAAAIAKLTGKSREPIEKKLHSIVLARLRLDEAHDAALNGEEASEEEVGEDYEKRKVQEGKARQKEKKRKQKKSG